DFTDAAKAGETATFPLKGLSQALIAIDTTQHRLGSERVAETPPYGLAPMNGTSTLPSALLSLHTASRDCDPLDDPGGDAHVIAGALDEKRTLYLIPCSTGAYNAAFRAYTLEGDTPRPLLFADYRRDIGWTGTATLINPEFDAGSKTLSTYDLYRGVGDCGS